MSEEFIILLFQAIDQQKWHSLPDFFHQQSVYERPGYQPFAGLDNILHFYCQERLIASGNHSLERVVVQDQQGICWGHLTGISKEGEELYARFADIYTFKDEKIIFRRTYFYSAAV